MYLEPSFTVGIEPERQLMRVVMTGFFSVDDAAALGEAKRAALMRMGAPANQHLTLVDVSGCKLQPQDVVRTFQSMIAEPRYMSRRIAFVTGSSLARMQVRRILSRDNAAFFETVEAAEAWLFQDQVLDADQEAA